jgi:hypothetical protein
MGAPFFFQRDNGVGRRKFLFPEPSPRNGRFRQNKTGQHKCDPAASGF